MKILVLGGTAWLGSATAAAAVREGHQVTCLARGDSGQVPDGAHLFIGDRRFPSAYEGLEEYDAAIEVSWQPRFVREALDHITADHWVYVSSVSVYDDDGSLVEPWNGDGFAGREEYAGAKVECELAYQAMVPEGRFVLARAGLIGGYGDTSDRLGYWPARLDQARGERTRVLVPPLDGASQVIDVLDLADWLVHCAVSGVHGTYDAVGHRSSVGEVVRLSAAAAGTSPELVEATAEQLLAAGVNPWSGPESLPLWAPGNDFLDRLDPGPAVAQGLALRPLADTIANSLRWEREIGIGRNRTSGLSAERETSVITSM